VKLRKTLIFAVALIAAVGIQSARAGDIDTILVRAKAGPTFYSNVDPISSTFSTGLDIGFRAANGFGITGTGVMSFQGSGYLGSGGSSSPTTKCNAKSLFLGVVPSFSVSKNVVTLTFGLGLGVLSLTQNQDVYGTGVSSYSTTETTRSRFALAPSFELDIPVYSGIYANAGMQYIAAFGSSPSPSYIFPSAGVGYRF
jgi:hypothetical protein